MGRDLHELPKVRDSWSYLYVEHCRVDQESKAIMLEDVRGRVPVPCANLTLLMLGPGTVITHAAIRALADNGCLAVWCGEQGVRFYAQGMGETRSSINLLHQARMWGDPRTHLEVVFRMYQVRFLEQFDPSMTLQQIRGAEGIRVRQAYQDASARYGVKWVGRNYDRRNWRSGDRVNRALSAANSCLYGVCHAAIVSAGYSPALGFIHTGKMMAFVYDVADLYKTEISIPVAFSVAAEGAQELETRARKACRDAFSSARLLHRIVDDIQSLLGVADSEPDSAFDVDQAAPGGLWDPTGPVAGGVNFGEGVTPDGRDDPAERSDESPR
jgi:CRISPR-associated protein Cas1